MQTTRSSEMAHSEANLEAGGHGYQQDGNKKIWWKKLLDLQEAKTQILFSMSMIVTNLFYYLVPLTSVMIAGHLGDTELAGATLANSWAGVTGFTFMVGVSGALETLCGQGFGAKLYGMLGIYLQASCIISLIISTAIAVLWVFTEPILILLHQDPKISKAASVYMKYLIPGLFAYGILQNILRFLQTQTIVRPLVLFSFIPLILNVGIAYALVHWTALGFKGAALAVSISFWISVFILIIYVSCAKTLKRTWEGFSLHSIKFLLEVLRLAIPSAAMGCLENFAFEILVFLAGLMHDAKRNTSIMAICVNTETIAFMLTYGLSASASTRVSNELGAGNPTRAKNAMSMSLKLAIILALALAAVLAGGHNVWAGLFTSSPSIRKAFASLTPFLIISIILDSVQGVMSGVARGCGWQYLVVYVNLATFYLIGVTCAVLLGFKLKLHVKGLWIGLICGLACQSALLFLIIMRKKWTSLDLPDKTKNEPVERRHDVNI